MKGNEPMKTRIGELNELIVNEEQAIEGHLARIAETCDEDELAEEKQNVRESIRKLVMWGIELAGFLK
jgi:hypothetical protein